MVRSIHRHFEASSSSSDEKDLEAFKAVAVSFEDLTKKHEQKLSKARHEHPLHIFAASRAQIYEN
jgi:hypothetical protein